MIISEFVWDDWNIEHISRHDVTPQEVEESCFNQPICRKTKNSLYLIYGQSDSGRYLLTVVRMISRHKVYTVTSRPMTDNEKIFYRQEK